MFDFDQVFNMMKIEPGHGMLQSILLFMIWLSSRSLRKEIQTLREYLQKLEVGIEMRFQRVEGRVNTLEIKQNKGG